MWRWCEVLWQETASVARTAHEEAMSRLQKSVDEQLAPLTKYCSEIDMIMQANVALSHALQLRLVCDAQAQELSTGRWWERNV